MVPAATVFVCSEGADNRTCPGVGHRPRADFSPYSQKPLLSGRPLLDEVRKLIGRSDKFTGNELEMIPGEDIEQYIERLRAKDPRFYYDVTIRW